MTGDAEAGGVVTWVAALPFLNRAGYRRLEARGLAVGPDELVAPVLRTRGAVGVAAVVVDAGVVGSDVPLGLVVPSLVLVRHGPIAPVSVDLSHGLGRLGLARWGDVLAVSRADLVGRDGVDGVTADELLAAALAAALAALTAAGDGDGARQEVRAALADFGRQLPQAFRRLVDRPGMSADRSLVAAAVADALVALVGWSAELPAVGFGDLLPGLGGVTVGIPRASLAAPVVAGLDAAGHHRWGDLEGCTVPDVLGWRHVGRRSASRFIALMVEAWLTARLGPVPCADDAAWKLVADLRALAATTRGETPSAQAANVAGNGSTGAPATSTPPAAVAAAGADLGELTRQLVVPLLVGECVADLERDLDERGRFILTARLAVPPSLTLVQIGERLGVSPERARQVQLRRRLHEADMAPVVGEAVRLRDELGAAFPSTSEDFPALESRVRELAGSDFGAVLLLWLAGPYVYDDGWLVAAAQQGALRGLGRRLRGRARGGIIPWSAVEEEGATVGLRSAVLRQWIEHLGGFRPTPDGLLPWTGSMVDRCELFLRHRGRPATAEELLAQIPDRHSLPSLRNVLREDRRFVRTWRTEYGLRAWGLEPYRSVADMILQEIERHDGSVRLDDLAGTLGKRWGVSEDSVRTFAKAPMFTVADGVVRVRTPDSPFTVARRLEDTASCYLVDGRWATRLDVDFDLLRGSGPGLPAAFAQHLGIVPGQRQRYATESGSVLVTWPTSSPSPYIGSLRVQAARLGAVRGDYLFIRDAGDLTLDCWLLPRATVERAAPITRLCLLAGQTMLPGRPTEIIDALMDSLGLRDRGMGMIGSWSKIRDALTHRGEPHLAELAGLLPRVPMVQS